MKIIIPGQTPAQKNNKQIVGIRPVPGKKGMWIGTPTITDNTRVKKWREEAAKHLSKAVKLSAELPPELHTGSLSGQVSIYYTFYVKDKRGRDGDNMEVSVNDALVKAGVIESDKWQILQSAGRRVEIDRDNPRAELEIVSDEWSIE